MHRLNNEVSIQFLLHLLEDAGTKHWPGGCGVFAIAAARGFGGLGRERGLRTFSTPNPQAQTNPVIGLSFVGGLSEGHHGSSRRRTGLSLRMCGGCGTCVVEIARLVRFKTVDQVPSRCR